MIYRLSALNLKFLDFLLFWCQILSRNWKLNIVAWIQCGFFFLVSRNLHACSCMHAKKYHITEVFSCIIFHNYVLWSAHFLIVIMYIQRLFLRFTTAPTQSVFATKKCCISEVDKFCEAVVNRKDSRTTKSTIYDLLWNGGLENVSDYTGCRHTQVLF
jgi:hypothetical protein